jgi:ParB-like chromosome segregation protein Spo0J
MVLVLGHRYKEAARDLAMLKKAIIKEVDSDFDKSKQQIKEQIQEAILARYLPESLLRRMALEYDPQVGRSSRLLRNSLCHRGSLRPRANDAGQGCDGDGP